MGNIKRDPEICDLPKCQEMAKWEGWARKADPLTGQPSGMIVLIQTCEEHRVVLLGESS